MYIVKGGKKLKRNNIFFMSTFVLLLSLAFVRSVEAENKKEAKTQKEEPGIECVYNQLKEAEKNRKISLNKKESEFGLENKTYAKSTSCFTYYYIQTPYLKREAAYSRFFNNIFQSLADEIINGHMETVKSNKKEMPECFSSREKILKKAKEDDFFPIKCYLTDEIGYNTTFLHQKICSITITQLSYVGGAAHPTTTSYSKVMALDSQKLLKITDLFMDSSEFLDFLSRYSYSELNRLLPPDRPRDEFLIKNIKDGTSPAIENFENYSLSENGVMISFGEIFSHADGEQKITIPWKGISPYLKPEYKFISERKR